MNVILSRGLLEKKKKERKKAKKKNRDIKRKKFRKKPSGLNTQSILQELALSAVDRFLSATLTSMVDAPILLHSREAICHPHAAHSPCLMSGPMISRFPSCRNPQQETIMHCLYLDKHRPWSGRPPASLQLLAACEIANVNGVPPQESGMLRPPLCNNKRAASWLPRAIECQRAVRTWSSCWSTLILQWPSRISSVSIPSGLRAASISGVLPTLSAWLTFVLESDTSNWVMDVLLTER